MARTTGIVEIMEIGIITGIISQEEVTITILETKTDSGPMAKMAQDLMGIVTIVAFMVTDGATAEGASTVIKVEIIHRTRILIAALKVVTQELANRTSTADKFRLMYTCPPLYSGQTSNYPPPGQQRLMMVDAYPAHPPVASNVPQLTYEPSVVSMCAPSQQ